MTKPRDPTQFTRESAERIGRVVRSAELATPGARPLTFERVDFSKSRVFRVCTYTGAWSVGSEKTVTFKYKTATPNTATVLNLFFPVTNTAAGTRDCAIAKEGTGWYLVDVKFATATAVFVTGTTSASYVSGITTSSRTFISALSATTASISFVNSVSAVLNTSSCSITVSTGAGEASIVTGVSTSGTAVIVLTASSTATAVFVTGTATATYLRLE